MKKLTLTAAALATAALVLAGSIGGARHLDQDADPVPQSFARMLEHEPYYGPTAGLAQAGGDPLAERIYSVLRRESASAGADSVPGADYWINVAESFRRTFSHQPYAGETSGVVRAAADPLEVAFYAMLRGEADVTRFASAGASARFE